MRRTLIRVTVGATILVLAAGVASSAFAAHGKFAPRMGFHGIRAGGFGPGGLMGGGFGFGGPMGGPFGMPALGRFGGPGMGPGGPGGPGGGVLTSDVLTPAASFLGFSSASALASDLKSSGKTLAQEATAKGKTASDLINAIVAAQKTNLDNEVSAGWITSDQETAILKDYTAAVTDLVNNGPPVPKAGGPMNGPLQTAATFLGMSVSDVQTALTNGKTLADLATAAGKQPSDLVTAILAPLKTKLDAAVSANTITSAQEAAILAHATTAVTDLVNGTRPTQTQMQTVKHTLVKFAILAFLKLHH
jgi:hypothetical protein